MWRHVWVGFAVILTCGKWSYHICELFYPFSWIGWQSVKVEQQCVSDVNSGLVSKEGIFAVRSALMGMPEQLLLDTRGWSIGDGPATFYSCICIQRRSDSTQLPLNVKRNMRVPTKDREKIARETRDRKTAKQNPTTGLSSKLCHYSTRPRKPRKLPIERVVLSLSRRTREAVLSLVSHCGKLNGAGTFP
jgi:hypothetical protein